tara:strand:- start:142 stop:660 length:519 start_codon:yes stop_codon:yes gene_type:complete
MKITRRELKKLILETILKEEKGKPIKNAKPVDEISADYAAKQIANPQKNKPAFKLFPSFDENHAGYEVYLSKKGDIGGGLHGVLRDPVKGVELKGGIHIDVPVFNKKEKDSHLSAEAEISKALMSGNLSIFAKGEASTHLGAHHGDVHIGHPKLKGKLGIHGTFGKHHKSGH